MADELLFTKANKIAQFITVCRSAKTCEIGENLLSVADPISRLQERLSHVGALIRPPTFQRRPVSAYIHTLRWKDRPLQCPRCQSQDVDSWGQYHYRPGGKRSWCNGCKRTFNDLTETLLHRSKRPLSYWILATFLLCLSCAARRIAREWVSIPGPGIAGAGGCVRRPCPTRAIVGWRARLKPMSSSTSLGTRGKPNRVGQSRWDADRGGAANSVSPAGGMTRKTGPRSLPGALAREQL